MSFFIPVYLYQSFIRILTLKRKRMKVLLDIQDDKAIHLLEVLKSLPYVKTKLLTEEKAQLMGEIREAVENLKLVREGKLTARPAKDLLDEL